MEYEIVKTFTITKIYTVEANSEEEALDYIEENPYCYDEEEQEEKVTINGEEYYN